MSSGFLFHLLQGQNLSELDKYRSTNDPKHLAEVGKNLTILAINDAHRRDIAEARYESEAKAREEKAAADAREAIFAVEREEDEIRRAVERSSQARSSPPSRTSDAGVDSFFDIL